MKKLLFLLSVALLLPLTMTATGPARADLQPNQMLLGHYTTDDLNTNGWKRSLLTGVLPIATDLTPEELAVFQGSEIVAFRIGLAQSTPVTRVFVIPIDGNGNLGTTTSWPCEVDAVGWNIVTLDSRYLINLPDNYSLRIGFDYEQTKTNKPISAVNIGTIYPSYILWNSTWSNCGLHNTGNLSLQLICENDNFPVYVIRARNLQCDDMLQIGDDLSFSFQVCNYGTGQVPAGGCVFNVAIDGNIVTTVTNQMALTSSYIDMTFTLPTDDLTSGKHTLTVTPVTVNGEPIENPTILTKEFKSHTGGFPRQMRLVEQFTSTGCTWCPTGSRALQALCDMRGDIAWVGVHVLFGSVTDPFASSQNDSISSYEHNIGYPEGSFDRTAGIENAGEVCGVLSYSSANAGAQVFNNFLEGISNAGPSWASVNINSTFDEATRVATISINGDLVPNFEDFMGSDSKLTVYITEDNLVAAQIDQGNLINNYVHNNVLRLAPGGVRGVKLNKDGDTYKNVFTVNIPSSWNADKLNIVAFISRPLRANALTDLYVTNANKRKLGEFDVDEGLRGDANGDGNVNTTDITSLISALLTNNYDDINYDNADTSQDGILGINDVVVLINYLLNATW